MTREDKREIVVEYEQIRLIRKTANTRVLQCAQCSSETDFLALVTAAELFEIDTDELFSFLRLRRCHFRAGETVLICLRSLMRAIKDKQPTAQIKLLGEKK
ncbi:MAG TPA: hypothetical protein VGO43_02535 [Pyrinomonadaceae bacterium]|jgi:hypothetical protein|nr:hypothetical protein [Pyrinomonadaceae bacterium]